MYILYTIYYILILVISNNQYPNKLYLYTNDSPCIFKKPRGFDNVYILV